MRNRIVSALTIAAVLGFSWGIQITDSAANFTRPLGMNF